jgi:hypothetical protein
MEYCPYSKSRVPSGTVRYEPVWFGYGSVRSGTVRVRFGYGRVRFRYGSGTVGYGPVRSSSVGSVLFGFVRSCSVFRKAELRSSSMLRSDPLLLRFGSEKIGSVRIRHKFGETTVPVNSNLARRSHY